MKDLNETKTQNTMKTIINNLQNIDRETVLKTAAAFSGLAVAMFSTFVIVTRLF